MSDYLDKFLDADELKASAAQPVRPNWVSDSNSSGAAYEAIQSLYQQKLRYIRQHSQKKDFKNKSTYDISNSEVARVVGVTMQSIFHSVNYAKELEDELADKNDRLLKSKESKLANRYAGEKGKTKDELIQKVRELKARDKLISKTTTDEVLELTLQRLPLDVKRNLKLV